MKRETGLAVPVKDGGIGLRIGTPAVTSRGMKEDEMVVIGKCIADIINNKEAAVERVGKTIGNLCEKFPLYENDVM